MKTQMNIRWSPVMEAFEDGMGGSHDSSQCCERAKPKQCDEMGAFHHTIG